jgi:hypothetical protein
MSMHNSRVCYPDGVHINHRLLEHLNVVITLENLRDVKRITMQLQSNPQQSTINPPIKCKTCNAPTYIIGTNYEPECLGCLEKRLGTSVGVVPDLEFKDGRLFWHLTDR